MHKAETQIEVGFRNSSSFCGATAHIAGGRAESSVAFLLSLYDALIGTGSLLGPFLLPYVVFTVCFESYLSKEGLEVPPQIA